MDIYGDKQTNLNLSDRAQDFLRIFCRTETPRNIQSLIDSASGDEAKTILLLESRFNATGFFESPHRNFSSKFFDPLRALYDDHGEDALTPPVLLASPLENVHKAITLLPPHLASQFDAANVHLGPLHSAEVGDLDRDRWRGEPPPSLLEWLVDDAMIVSTDSSTSGEFSPSMSWSLMRTLCKQRAQVRVDVSWGKNKGEKEEEGCIITGYLRGFDRHRNLLLLNHKWEKSIARGGGGGGGGGGEDSVSSQNFEIQGARAILIKGSEVYNISVVSTTC